MEGGSLDMAGGGGDASRSAIGFPLGSALLLLAIFCLSGAFSCCYHHRNMLKTFFSCGRHSIPAASFPSSPVATPSPSKSSPLLQEKKLEGSLSLPVLVMPGDRFPKYIAWPSCHPSPRAPPMDNNISMQAHCP